MKAIKVLKSRNFDKKNEKVRIEKALNELSKNIKAIEDQAEEFNIYLRIDDRREREKVLCSLFPFLHNANYFLNRYDIDKIVNDIEVEYNNRIPKALSCCGFVSIDENKKTIKCKKKYDFGNIDLSCLMRIASFETDLNNTGKDSRCIDIIKEYKNLNVEFRFKSDVDYETFKTLIYYHNDETEYIINNAPENVRKEYIEKKKKKYSNEVYVLYNWSKENCPCFKWNVSINTNLINKAWRC